MPTQSIAFANKVGAFTPDVLSAGLGFGGLFSEFAQDNITATPSGTQTNSFQISGQTVRIITVATAGDGIVLPASAAGLELLVINHGANAMTCFAAGTDTIDDIAGATGVSQMSNSLVIYTCATAGKWYSEGLATGYGGSGLQTVSFADGVTAAGNSQGTATVLTPRMITNVTTVGAGTGVLLPTSAAGLVLAVNNNQATNTLNIFPNGTDKINAGGAGVAFSAAVSTITILYCFTAGQWFTK